MISKISNEVLNRPILGNLISSFLIEIRSQIKRKKARYMSNDKVSKYMFNIGNLFFPLVDHNSETWFLSELSKLQVKKRTTHWEKNTIVTGRTGSLKNSKGNWNYLVGRWEILYGWNRYSICDRQRRNLLGQISEVTISCTF